MSHLTPLSGGNLAQDGGLLAFLSGKEGTGQRVRAAGQTGAVCTEAVWGSRGEGSLLPLKCGSLQTGAVCTEAAWDTQGEGCPPNAVHYPVSSSLKPRDQKANIPWNPSKCDTLSELLELSWGRRVHSDRNEN